MATGCSDDASALPERSAGVSRLELFFDLVFVFTVTQLTGVLVDGGDAAALVQVVVMLLLIWWMYDGDAWLTNAIATDRLRFGLLLIGGMGGFLVIALAVPNAYDGDGLVFGLGYLVVVLLHAGMFVRGTSVSEVRAMLRIAPFNLIAVTLVLVGGSLGDDPQWILWALAGILLWFTPRFTTVEGFVVSVSHFVERHGLVVIVALGESIVVIGTGAAELALDPGLVLVALLSLSLSAALWRIYFSDEEAVERALHGMAPQLRAQSALTGFGYWHYGILLGIVARRGRPEQGDRPPLRPAGALDRTEARSRHRPLHPLRHRLPADLRDRTQPHPAAGRGGGTGHNPARQPAGRCHPGRSDRGARHRRARSGMDSRQRTRELAIPFGFSRARGPAIGLLPPSKRARHPQDLRLPQWTTTAVSPHAIWPRTDTCFAPVSGSPGSLGRVGQRCICCLIGGGPMTVLLDAAGRRRSPATLPGYHAGRPPRNKGVHYPADPPTVEEIVAVMRHAPDDRHGWRVRAMIVVLWRAGLRIQEALALAEHDLDQRRGSLLVRSGKGGRRREVGMDEWGWEQLRPWLSSRAQLPVGPLFCVIDGATRGRPWSAAAVRGEFRRLAAAPGLGAASRRTSCATRMRSSSRGRALRSTSSNGS